MINCKNVFMGIVKLAIYCVGHVLVFIVTGSLWGLQRVSELIIFLGTCMRESIDSITVTFGMGLDNNLTKADFTADRCVELTKRILGAVFNKPYKSENSTIIDGRSDKNQSFALVSD